MFKKPGRTDKVNTITHMPQIHAMTIFRRKNLRYVVDDAVIRSNRLTAIDARVYKLQPRHVYRNPVAIPHSQCGKGGLWLRIRDNARKIMEMFVIRSETARFTTNAFVTVLNFLDKITASTTKIFPQIPITLVKKKRIATMKRFVRVGTVVVELLYPSEAKDISERVTFILANSWSENSLQ